MDKVCRVCDMTKKIERGDVCGACRSRKSRAKQHTEATREQLLAAKTQLKKEKEQNDVRVKALKVLATISQLKPYMLPEEVVAVRAIIEPYTLPMYKVAYLSSEALSRLVTTGDLVDEEADDQDAQGEAEDAPSTEVIRGARTPSEMRRDVSAALQTQGFRVADIDVAANRMPWNNGVTFDEQLKLMLAVLRPLPTVPTRTAKISVVNTPSEKYTVRVAMVDESSLTLPQTIEQRVKQVPA
jgi:hypothetical protein